MKTMESSLIAKSQNLIADINITGHAFWGELPGETSKKAPQTNPNSFLKLFQKMKFCCFID